MQCSKCGSLKQLTPESRRTETSVWRRRVCKGCHHTWVTEEQIRPDGKMPTEVWNFHDNVVRRAPKDKPSGTKVVKPKFDTSGIQQMPW